MTAELLHIPFSPWSEKARWALDARAVPYRAVVYQPLLGEPRLRARLKKWRGNVSVPVLFAEGAAVPDSLAIARWADAHGSGPTLFPSGAEARIEAWNALAERGLAAGRARSLERVLERPGALREMLPKKLAPALGRLGLAIAAAGVRRTLRKYGATRADRDGHRAELEAVLDELRAALADGNGHLVPEHGFTFADIAMAQVLGFVSPPARGLRIGKNNREAFHDPDLAPRYGDLIAWRDALYEAHRPTAPATGPAT